MNVGGLASGSKSIVPCTPLGCLFLIKSVEKNLEGKNAVILGRSNLNGKPMAQLLLKRKLYSNDSSLKNKRSKNRMQKS